MPELPREAAALLDSVNDPSQVADLVISNLDIEAGEKQEVLAANNVRERLRKGAVATHTAEANQQHYEVPTDFFRHVLGAKRKYSSCYWPEGVTTLDQAEDAMLELYAERLRVQVALALL